MKTANKYLLFFYFLTVGCIIAVGLINGDFKQQPNYRNVSPKRIIQKVDARVEAREIARKIEISKTYNFLKSYNSPLTPYSQDIVDASYIFGIDYRVLVSISGAESSFCKVPARGTTYNCFGWSSSTAPGGFYRFNSYKDAIWYVAQRLGTDRTYQEFQRTGSVRVLAINYNNGSQDWINSVIYFINLI